MPSPARVALHVSVRHRPPEHRADALAQAPRRLLPRAPDRRQHRQDLLAAYGVHRQVPEDRVRVALERLQPRRRVLAVPPPRAVRLERAPRRLAEHRGRGPAPLRQGVPAAAHQPPVLERHLPGIRQSDDGKRPQPDVAPPPLDDDSLDPLLAAPARDPQVERRIGPVQTRVPGGPGRRGGQVPFFWHSASSSVERHGPGFAPHPAQHCKRDGSGTIGNCQL